MDFAQITKTLDDFYKLISVNDTLILVSLMFLGIILKQMPYIKNDLIPLILWVVGEAASVYLIRPPAVGLLKGLCYSGIAILFYEMLLKYVYAWVATKFGPVAPPDNSQPPAK